MSSLFVPTVETTRLTYLLSSLVAGRHYPMFVGNTGTGKTAIMRAKLKVRRRGVIGSARQGGCILLSRGCLLGAALAAIPQAGCARDPDWASVRTQPSPPATPPQLLDPEVTCFHTINMNSFSDAPSLQIMLEQPLEKKSGVRYGPPGSRRCWGAK